MKIMKKLTHLKDQTVNWIKNNKKEAIIIGLIILIGSVMRLYRIGEYMTFLGDEGRDAVVVRRLLVYADPILVGPGTSIGNMYLGPLYYYLIAPSLLLAGFSPVGPSIMVALLGILTIGLIYKITKEWFGKTAAAVAALLYAISPTVIIYSRSSWNPNVMPFFALMCIYSIWNVWQKKQYKWLISLGICFAFVLNSHYLGLILAPVLGLFWLVTLIKHKANRKQFINYSLLSMAVFLFLMSPLVIFDARHGWNNFGAIKKFFSERETTVSIKPWKALPNSWPIYEEFTTRLLGGRDMLAGKLVAFGVFDLVVLCVVKMRLKFLKDSKYQILLAWVLAATIGLALYKQHIYDHYYGFFFPAVFILFAAMLSKALETKYKILRYLLIASVVVLVGVNLYNSPLKFGPNRQLQRSQEVARKVIEYSEGRPFNFALIAQQNYEAGYRYFLDVYKAKAVDIDPMNTAATIQDQLIVICEMPEEKCDPTHNAKAEVANFGWSGIENKWSVEGITIYKLIHTR